MPRYPEALAELVGVALPQEVERRWEIGGTTRVARM